MSEPTQPPATPAPPTNLKPPARNVISLELNGRQVEIDLSLSEREISLLKGLRTWHQASVQSGIVLGQPM